MSQNKKHKILPAGDYMTEEEASFDDFEEIERRCETIEEVVNEKVLTLTEALEAYNVEAYQFIGYILMRYKKGIPKDEKTLKAIVIELTSLLVNLTHITRFFNSRFKAAAVDLKDQAVAQNSSK